MLYFRKRRINYDCYKSDLGSQRLATITANHEERVDPKHCKNLQKPMEFEACQGPCEKTRWKYNEWTEVRNQH